MKTPFFHRLLTDHLGTEPAKLPIVSETFTNPDHPNLHRALESYLAAPGRSHRTIGFSDTEAYMTISLSMMAQSVASQHTPTEGPVEYRNVCLANGQVVACLKKGLFLASAGGRNIAALLSPPPEIGIRGNYTLEVMAPEREHAEAFLEEIRSRIRKENVYRGQVISLELDDMHNIKIKFHHLPKVAEEAIILPQGILERIKRQTIGFGRHKEKLAAAGRHLKRGLLLHGPPGTGKTFSAMHLAGNMPDRTIFLLTGRGLGLIEASCSMARLLQPSMVILEDVDLVAEERTSGSGSCNGLLFELLNQMDGLDEDADIIFILTTNRPDILEPALAARPGRIDLAVEIPAPDDECRGRLFELYLRGLASEIRGLPAFVRRTEGVSAAFIRELVRKAALIAADEEGEIRVRDEHIESALEELLLHGGALTQALLGAKRPQPQS